MNALEYKGYTGRLDIDPEAGLFHGEVDGLRDVVTFEGRSFDELEKAFRESVDDYLALCDERGEEPEKPFSGRLVLRMGSDLHRAVALEARMAGSSINQWIADVLSGAVRKTPGRLSRPSRRTASRD